MTKNDILTVAMRQSALDMNCHAEDFQAPQNVIVHSAPHPQARKYLELPLFFDMVTYGHNIVASVDERIEAFTRRYIERVPSYHCFDMPRIHLLNEELQKHGHLVCFMAEYFLPDPNALRELDCALKIKLLYPEDFAKLYLPQWSNALCEKRKHLDMLAVGAYDGDTLVALAGCSADCETMWQIGIDTLPAYRGRGIASALTARLALEVLKRGKVPFYCCAWSNIASCRNAIASGLRPAWVELTGIEAQKTMSMV